MVDALGFLGLILNLTSMTMKNIFYLRYLSLTANAIYAVYGLFIGAIPIIIGSIVAVVIHAIRLYKLKQEKSRSALNPV